MNLSKHAVCSAIFLLFSLITFAQKTSITGKITDASTGAGVGGVTVKVRSTGATTVTNTDGSFSVQAEKNDVLEINSLSYSSQNVSVSGRTTINISLASTIQDLGQVVLVGSRSSGRIKTETAVPVDVIKMGAGTLSSGRMDLTSILNYAAPSFNFNKQSGSDGADHMDLATLRGLNPDQTLVLINGKREHQTAFVAVFGTKGRGASGTDLTTIPMGSIDHIEILRDGASAQYGSDAIAGVINIVLKKNVKQLTGDVGYSGYDDHAYNPYYSSNLHNQYLYSGPIDGQEVTVNLNYGLPLGTNGGFLNLTGNFVNQGKTYRQVLDTSMVESVLLSDPKSEPIDPYRRGSGEGSQTAGGIFYNMEVPVANSKTTFYAFGGFNENQSDAYAFTRYWNMFGSGQTGKFPTNPDGSMIFVPGIMRVVPLPSFYQGSYANDTVYDPHIQSHVQDFTTSIGLKGVTHCGWNWDLSNTIGRNDFHYFGDQTFNASLGANQTHFDDGGFNLLQNTANFDVNKKIASVAEGLNLAFGAEYRFENYKIYQGEFTSWAEFDPTFTKVAGAEGYPGYQPSDVVNATRNVQGIYADAELDVTRAWLLDVAVRAENYSDFGFTSNYKLATRYKISHDFNLRGSVSTGFRAPSLPQINFSNTFSNVSGGASYFVKIAPNSGPLAKAMGLPVLKQEKSVNASLGFSWKPIKELTVTVDGYYVALTNRIVLSGIFDTSVPALLQYSLSNPEIQHAQFFTNAVNTSNYGVDLVFDYKLNFINKQHFNVLLAANFQKCIIDKINIPPAFNDNAFHQQLFYSPREQSLLKATAPPEKISLNLEYGIDKFAVGTRFTYFGALAIFGQGNAAYAPPFGVAPIPLDAPATGAVPDLYNYAGKATTDVYVSYKLSKETTVFLGADNLFNVHPTLGIVQGAKLNDVGDTESGGPFDAVQMGQDGTRLFAKISFSL